jgi:tRNA threonylcarbamoyladenosine biosynthesis protein TsaE
LRWISPSPEATHEAGRRLAAAIDPGGLAIGLVGPLGAGKTAFVKGLAAGLGLDPALVASPTFVIVSEYATPHGLRLAHVDCLRVESETELEAAGFLDLLVPGVVLAVEWSDRFPQALPADRLELRLTRALGPGAVARRELNAVAFGPTARAALARWQAALARDPAPSGLASEPPVSQRD